MESTNYVDLANAYGDYLRATWPDRLQDGQAGEEVPVNVELIGAINKKVVKLGMPVDSVVPTTTFEQARKIMNELHSAGVKALNIRMTGWANGGVRQKVLTGVNILGELGGKIHAGRSRNDQVLVDLKLFLRDELKQVREEVLTLFGTLQTLSERFKDVLLPGYTHTQLAMPSSFGMWLGAYAEALADDMQGLQAAYRVVNRNPLGSAAGYGSSFPLDRAMTTRLLDFDTPVYNSVAAQLGRGKCELAVASALAGVALTLNKFAVDCIFGMSPGQGFIHFPDELTTGSSIMPHKKNPDVWEILRGRCNRILACPNEIAMLNSNLQHGYHRDFQLLKEILFPALEQIHECLQMADYMIRHMDVNTHIFDDPRYELLFTVEEVNRRTLAGTPFRDAYRQVGIEVNQGQFHYAVPAHASELGHTHLGSLGNLCTKQIAAVMEKAAAW